MGNPQRVSHRKRSSQMHVCEGFLWLKAGLDEGEERVTQERQRVLAPLKEEQWTRETREDGGLLNPRSNGI